MLPIMTPFLSNRSQLVMVDACQCKLVNVVERRAAEQCFGTVTVPSVHLGAFFYFEE